MSKKIAEGIGGLVLDVKTGERRLHEDAGGLARGSPSRSCRSAARRASGPRRSSPRWTRRSAALVGNALEVIESIETLKGRGPADLEQLSVQLAARMLVAGGRASATRPRRRRASATRCASGAGLEKFRRIIEHQGGDPRVVDDYDRAAVRAGPSARGGAARRAT